MTRLVRITLGLDFRCLELVLNSLTIFMRKGAISSGIKFTPQYSEVIGLLLSAHWNGLPTDLGRNRLMITTTAEYTLPTVMKTHRISMRLLRNPHLKSSSCWYACLSRAARSQ